MSDSLDDPFIQELIAKFGANGYLAWFGIIEIICKENGTDVTGKLSISPTFLKQKFHISSGKLQEIFRFSSGKGKLFFNISEDLFHFSFNKILEIKDNYTKDLQASCKKLSNHKEEEVEADKEVEVEKERNIALPSFLDAKLWKDFKEYRQRKKAPLTKKACELIYNKLAKFHAEGQDPNKVIEQSMENGWAGVFPLREDRNNGKSKHSAGIEWLKQQGVKDGTEG